MPRLSINYEHQQHTDAKTDMQYIGMIRFTYSVGLFKWQTK